jgi:hypothetical protein
MVALHTLKLKPGPDLEPVGFLKVKIKYIDDSGKARNGKYTAQYTDLEDIHRVSISDLCEFLDHVGADKKKLSISDGLVSFYYNRVRKQLALKLIFVICIQHCVWRTYNRKLPTWFRKNIRNVRNKKLVEDYFVKAQKIFNCIMLYEPHDDKYDVPGHLAKTLALKKAGWATTGRQKHRAIKFKDVNTLKNQCKMYGGKGDLTIFHIVDIILHEDENGPKMKFFKHMGCDRYLNYMKSMFEVILTEPHIYIETLLNIGYITAIDAITELTRAANQCMCSSNYLGHFEQKLIRVIEAGPEGQKRASATRSIQDNATQQTKVSTQRTEETKVSKPTSNVSTESGTEFVNISVAKVFDQNPPPDEYLSANPATNTIKVQGDNAVLSLKINPSKYSTGLGSLADDLWEEAKTQGVSEDFDADTKFFVFYNWLNARCGNMSGLYANARVTDKSIITPTFFRAFYAAAKAQGFGRYRYRNHRSGFGSGAGGNYPRLADMIGYVKPYNISAAEQYTGMTPSMYKSHLNSMTATPYGSKSPISRANNYYGMNRLGDSLNPSGTSFGARRSRSRQNLFTDGKKVYQIVGGKKSRSRFGSSSNFFFR